MLISKIRQGRAYQRVVSWTKRNERFWIPLMLLGGLLTDILQFTTFDVRLQFVIVGVYAILCATTLIAMNLPKPPKGRLGRFFCLVAPFVHQFTLGNLLSVSLLFYWFSGAFSVSWPLIALAALLMFSNEFWRERFLRPAVQIGVLAFALTSLTAIIFSYLFNSLSATTFVAATAFATAAMILFSLMLAHQAKLISQFRTFLITILVIGGLMNMAYVLNIIPPIPLAIREAGIYYDLQRVNGDYRLDGPEEDWPESWLPGQQVTVPDSGVLYAYTAIFAPVNLTTNIVHEWQYYDAVAGRWTTAARLSFVITGGRAEGYRGYSRKSQLTSGRWRVNVKTERGQVLGRIPFEVLAP